MPYREAIVLARGDGTAQNRRDRDREKDRKSEKERDTRKEKEGAGEEQSDEKKLICIRGINCSVW